MFFNLVNHDFRHLKTHGMTWSSYQAKLRAGIQLQEQQPPPSLHSPELPRSVLPPVPVPMLPPVSAPVQVETFDEDDFMEKLSKLRRTKSSIESAAKLCTSCAPAYKVVRCLDKQLRKVPADQKLTLFYLFHELTVETKKKEDFNKRLGKSILGILPNIIDILPQSRVMKCVGIWGKSLTFSKEVVKVLKKIVSDSQSLNSPVNTAQVGLSTSSSSKKSCYRSGFTFASPKRKTVDERLEAELMYIE